MKPNIPAKGPDLHKTEPSPPGSDPHAATEEIGKDQEPGTPKTPHDPHKLDRDEERRVNNGLHDGKKFLNR